jgi:proline dehydrogenase
VSIARSILLRASRSRWLESQFRRRRFAQRAVRRFMPGEDLQSALGACRDLAASNLGTVLTNLGERTESREAALAVRDHYLGVLDDIAARKVPTEVSVKLTHLGMSIDFDACTASVIALARRAGAAHLWIDMEESQYVDQTLELFRRVRAQCSNAGLCLQSYLRRTPADLESLMPLAPAIRLVKGAYREPPDVAFPKKSDTDSAYFELSRRLLEAAAAGRAFPVFGTHDLALIERIRQAAANVPAGRWEVHMLYGIKSGEQARLAASGVRVRTLISYGTNWYPWYVRRLAERPANVWFVVRNLW